MLIKIGEANAQNLHLHQNTSVSYTEPISYT